MLLYFLWDRYATRFKFEINSQNTLFARFVCPHHKKNGKIGLAFYGLKIVNISKKNLSIKEVLVRYTLGGSEFTTESHVLLTGTIYSPLEKKDINAIIVKVGTDDIVLMNWDNLRTEIGKHKFLSPGEVLSGSAFFALDFDTTEAISKLEKLKIVIVDYSGKETLHPISIEDEWIRRAEQAVVENRSFTNDGNGQIKFV